MQKSTFTVPSSDGIHNLHGVSWLPEGEVRAVVQICHGMVEYIERYEELAVYLAERGYAVFGHDHLGHGHSVNSQEELGFFAEEQGNVYVIKDMHRVTRKAVSAYPSAPVYLIGHSMGSFFLRKYLTIYGTEINGAILCGTGYHSRGLITCAKLAAGLVVLFGGKHKRSQLLYSLTLGAADKAFADEKLKNAWLSKNRENVERYNQDPLCSFRFTAGAYRDFFRILADLSFERGFEAVPRDLPVLLIAGEKDPIGDMGEGVKKVASVFERMNMQDVTVKLYPQDRHEIFNEEDREKVFEDVEAWMENHLEEN